MRFIPPLHASAQRSNFDHRRLFQRSDFSRGAPFGQAVQIAEIRLPPNRDDTAEDWPILEWEEGEVERRDSGPQLTRVDAADGDGFCDALPRLGQRRARQQRLHPKEICIEDGREAYLVDDNLGC